MELQNKVILESVEALNKFVKLELPIKVAYQVKKNLEAIRKQVEFINEQRNELIRKYGKGDTIDTTDTVAVEGFMKDFNEVLEIVEDLDIVAIDLGAIEDVKVSVNDLEALSFMLCTQ